MLRMGYSYFNDCIQAIDEERTLCSEIRIICYIYLRVPISVQGPKVLAQGLILDSRAGMAYNMDFQMHYSVYQIYMYKMYLYSKIYVFIM